MPPGPARRDAITAAAMLAAPPEAGRRGIPASSPAPAITIPGAGKLGPARVPTGYPQTPEGAVGQLASIETTVLQGMSIEAARTTYRAWSVPDAPPVQRWELLADIQAFLGSGAGRYTDDLTTAVVATPVAGQVKGADGPDWVVACVLLDVTARAATRARIAYGHCARMQWSSTGHGRWVIAAGPAPGPRPLDLARHGPRRAGRLAHLGTEHQGVRPARELVEHINPFTYLGNAAGQILTDGWTAAMLGIWNAGLWLLRLVLGIEDDFLVPDLSENGPMSGDLPVHLLSRRRSHPHPADDPARHRRLPPRRAEPGRGPDRSRPVRHGLGRWVAYAVAVLAAAGGLTRALMRSLLKVDAMAAWQPWKGPDAPHGRAAPAPAGTGPAEQETRVPGRDTPQAVAAPTACRRRQRGSIRVERSGQTRGGGAITHIGTEIRHVGAINPPRLT